MNRFLVYVGFLLLFIAIAPSCTKPDEARKALIQSGYHPIKVEGYSWTGCGKGDVYATKFKAYTADSSSIVTGVVCQGFFKGKTIRLD